LDCGRIILAHLKIGIDQILNRVCEFILNILPTIACGEVKSRIPCLDISTYDFTPLAQPDRCRHVEA